MTEAENTRQRLEAFAAAVKHVPYEGPYALVNRAEYTAMQQALRLCRAVIGGIALRPNQQFAIYGDHFALRVEDALAALAALDSLTKERSDPQDRTASRGRDHGRTT